MEESDDDIFQFTVKKDSMTDNMKESVERLTTMSRDDIFLVADNMHEEDGRYAPTPVRFHEVICCEHSNSRVDAYIDYVFNNFRPVSPRSMLRLDVIRSVFDERRISSHFETVVEDSTSHSQTCDYIRDVIDDVLQDLVGTDIEIFTTLTSSGKKLLISMVKNRIFEHQVKILVAKIIQKAVKQFEMETKRVGLKPSPPSNKEDGGKVNKSWSLENNSEDSSVLQTADLSLKLPRIEVQPPMYAHLPRYLPVYQPHVKSSDYVAMPCLYNLPLYATVPFPVCFHKHTSLSGGRTTRLGHSTYAVPNFYYTQCTTQVYSKLVKYYNSFK